MSILFLKFGFLASQFLMSRHDPFVVMPGAESPAAAGSLFIPNELDSEA